MALRSRKAVEEAYPDVGSAAPSRKALDRSVHGVADLLTTYDAEKALYIMATVVYDAADPTTEAELTRTRRPRGERVSPASVQEPVTESHRAEQPGHAPEKLNSSRRGKTC